VGQMVLIRLPGAQLQSCNYYKHYSPHFFERCVQRFEIIASWRFQPLFHSMNSSKRIRVLPQAFT